VSKVFICYRRDDSADAAGRLYDRLVQHFGADSVVMDVDSIPLGVDFREFLSEAVGRCRVLLAVIGPQWLPIINRRRDDPLDFVRLEIEAALQRRIPVIPILVSGAAMPGPDQLPAPLRLLAFRNGTAVRRNPDFHRDVDRLVKSLDRLLQSEGLPPSTSEPQARPREITNALGMTLVLVPRGMFWMGARGISRRHDHGRHKQVTIPQDFYLGAFPVTQEQWQAVMGSNPSYFSRNGGGADRVKGFSDAGLNQFPVEQVSWEDVQEFLKRLNAREKDSGFLYRLPTEAEWEYSCRGGASSQQYCAFDFYFAQPTNDLSSEQANFDGNHPAGNAPKGKYLERTTKVGSYKPNRLGLYDMHGNVWEWCEDHFETGGSARVVRGGSWRARAVSCRASNRGRGVPADRDGLVGFRLAAVPSGE
jgi:formylglycine-generating enzyme required for sulfatase activity